MARRPPPRGAFPGASCADTGFGRSSGFNPSSGYASTGRPFRCRGEPDTRRSPIERVAAVDLNGDAVAYPFALLEEERVIHDTVGGEEIVVFFQFGTASALDAGQISDGRDVGVLEKSEITEQNLLSLMTGSVDAASSSAGSAHETLSRELAMRAVNLKVRLLGQAMSFAFRKRQLLGGAGGDGPWSGPWPRR